MTDGPSPPFLTCSADLLDATALLALFGEAAPAQAEAAARARRSRDLGNVPHFCRWRQIERLIALLASEQAIGTVH